MRRFLKKRFRVTVLVLLLLLIGGYIAYQVMLDPELIRQKARHTLSEMLGVEVEVTGARFHPLSGLTIDEVIIPVDFDGKRQEFARLHDLHAVHYVASLFTGRLNIRELRASKLSLNLVRAADGSTNLKPIIDTLRSRPPRHALLPTVRVGNLELAYHDEMTLDREGRPFDIKLLGVLATLTPRAGQPILDVVLAVDDPQLGRWQVREATIDVKTGEVAFVAESNRLPINEALRDRLGGRGREIMDSYGPPSEGTVKLTLHLSTRSGRPEPVEFKLDADIQGMTISSIHFPYLIEDITGVVTFNPDGTRIQHLTGRSGPAKLTFAGSFDGYARGVGCDLVIQGERLRLDEKLHDAFRENNRKVYKMFAPSGMIDCTVKLKRPRGPNRRFSVSIDARNSQTGAEPVEVTYQPFPYRLKLVGSGSYRDGLSRIDAEHPVVGTHGDNTFAIWGTINRGRPCSLIDLTIQGKEVQLNRDLYETLPKDSRRMWDTLQPEGKAGVTVTVKRKDPAAVLADVTVLIDHLKTSFSCRDFPFRTDATAGTITYQRGRDGRPICSLTIENLKGRRGKTLLTANGKLFWLEPQRPVQEVNLTVNVENLLLNDDLKKAVPDSVLPIWDFLQPTPEGLVNIDCVLTRTRASAPGLDARLKLTAVDVSLECKAFPYRLDHLAGVAHFARTRSGQDASGGEMVLTRLRSVSDEGATVELNGSIGGFERGEAPKHVDLTISGKDVPLDDKLRRSLSPAYGRTFDALSPTGKVDVFCRLERDATADKATPACPESIEGSERQACRGAADDLKTWVLVTTKGNRIRYENMPVPLEEVTGEIDISRDLLLLSNLSGKALGGKVTLSGSIRPSEDQPSYDLYIRGGDILLDGQLLEIVPEQHRERLRRLKPSGRADVGMSLVKDWPTPTEPRVRYKATFGLRDASIVLETADSTCFPWDPESSGREAPPRPERVVRQAHHQNHPERRRRVEGDEPSDTPGESKTHKLTHIEGVLTVVGVTGAKDNELHGHVNLARLDVWKLRFEDLRTRFERRANGWGLYDLQAGLYGGHIRGDVQIRRDSWRGFATVLKLEDLELGRVGTEVLNMRPGQVRGKLSGTLELQGVRPGMNDLIGRAKLEVREGKLWELPIILSLLNVLNIPSLDRTAFTEANTEIDIYGDTFHFRKLDLLGSTISIYGEGYIAAVGDMNLTFLTGISRFTVPDVPIVNGLLKAAQKQLMLVRAHGTVRDTRLDLEPIAPITGTLKAVWADLFGRRDTKTVLRRRKEQ